jgi:hypothetical protein
MCDCDGWGEMHIKVKKIEKKTTNMYSLYPQISVALTYLHQF